MTIIPTIYPKNSDKNSFVIIDDTNSLMLEKANANIIVKVRYPLKLPFFL